MAVEIFLPKMSDHMETGLVLRWFCKEGDVVELGQPLLEIETDKATGELDAPASGILKGVRVAEGATVAVGATLALIVQPGETISELKQPLLGRTESTEKQLAQAEVKATPLARRVAKDLKVDLARVKGSGPNGIIRDEDVSNYATSLASSSQASTPTAMPQSKVQLVTGQRMAESFNRAPHFYVQVSVDMTRALDLLEQIKRKIELETGESITLTVLIVKAAAAAIQKMPRLNTVFDGEHLSVSGDINIGIAISIDEELVVPVIKQANSKSLAEITVELKQFQARATHKKLTLEDLSGGTFTISNLGMFGVDVFHAIINPPQSSILAVGRVAKTPVGMPNDTIALRPMMNLALSADHRVLDGVQAARFLGELKGLLESPVQLL